MPPDDPKKWTDADTAPVPARVFQKRSLGIDKELLSRIKSRAPRIRSHLVDHVEHFAPFIRQSRAGGVKSKAEYRDAAEGALRDARSLVEAKQIIGKLHADTLTRRDALVALYPSSSQDHQKRAFVRILAEGWVFLTGKMPGKNLDPSKNPFLRVVEAAWIDWHQVNNSDAAAFGEALNAAISSIDDARLKWLRAEGPASRSVS